MRGWLATMPGTPSGSFAGPGCRKETASAGALLPVVAAVEVWAEQHEDAFNKRIDAIDRLLDLARGREAHGQEAANATAEEEERRRQRREERAKLLEDRQAARDPQRTVAMRLSDAREAMREGDVLEGAPHVPMMVVDFQSLRGREKVPLVDVRKIRSSCQQLDERPTVASLLELQLMKERFTSVSAPRRGGQRSQDNSSGMGSRRPATASTPALSSALLQSTVVTAGGASLSRTQEKVLLARSRKQAQMLSIALQKTYSMRGEAPEAATLRIQALAAATMAHKAAVMQAVQVSPNVNSDAPRDSTAVSAAFSEESIRALSRSSVRGSLMKAGPCRGSIGLAKEMPPTRSGGAAPHAARGSVITASGRMKGRFAAMLQQKQQKEKARRRLRVLRAVVRWLCEYLKIHRLNRCCDVAKSFLVQLGESERFKFSIQQLRMKLKKVMIACRAYSITRQQRLFRMSSTWEEVEDKHLSAYSDSLSKKFVEENGLSAKDATYASTSFDWKRFRIPSRERVAVLSRYYTTQLLKHVRDTHKLVKAFQKQVCEEQDLVGFANDGRRPSLTKATRDTPKFWQISEETVLDLIATSAHALRGMEPFRHHPAVAGASIVPTNLAPKSMQHNNSYAGLSLKLEHWSGSTGLAQQKEGAPADLHSRPSSSTSACADAGPAAAWRRARNVEDLLARFTPRICIEGTAAPATPQSSSTVGYRPH